VLDDVKYKLDGKSKFIKSGFSQLNKELWYIV